MDPPEKALEKAVKLSVGTMAEDNAAKEATDHSPSPAVPEKHGNELGIVVRIVHFDAVFVSLVWDVRRIVHKIMQSAPDGNAGAVAVASLRRHHHQVGSRLTKIEPGAVDYDVLEA